MILSFKHVNTAKFSVLHEIERKFPMNLFEYEWELMERGENKKKYATFSKVEIHVPFTFALIYFALLIVFLHLYCPYLQVWLLSCLSAEQGV